MDADEFWRVYCSRGGGYPMSDAQEAAIEMFLEAMEEILWKMPDGPEQAVVRRGIIHFMQSPRRRPPHDDMADALRYSMQGIRAGRVVMDEISDFDGDKVLKIIIDRIRPAPPPPEEDEE